MNYLLSCNVSGIWKNDISFYFKASNIKFWSFFNFLDKNYKINPFFLTTNKPNSKSSNNLLDANLIEYGLFNIAFLTTSLSSYN